MSAAAVLLVAVFVLLTWRLWIPAVCFVLVFSFWVAAFGLMFGGSF